MTIGTLGTILGVLAAIDAAGDVAAYPNGNLLAEVLEVQTHQGLNHIKILDARSREHFQAGHIPGAIWIDHAAWSKAFVTHRKEDWENRVGALGLAVDDTVVVYDDNATKDAARIWWILRYWGFRDARILNGGWRAWQSAGGKISQVEPAPHSRRVQLNEQPQRLATKEQVLKSLEQKDLQIVDARSREEYLGEVQTAKRNGSIPCALNLEWLEVIDPKTQRFKSSEDLRMVFRKTGIDPARPTVTYCQSGGRAAVVAFALELMGAKDVCNYYRSWAEWGNAQDTPIEKAKPK
jgi:thiosulfate/3-mercaptopyruvate sulfurtransferase